MQKLAQIPTTKSIIAPLRRNFGKKNRKKSSRLWIDRHTSDHYTKKAKKMDYRGRSAFKLLEINIRHKILKPGKRVYDLGCCPGGWLQVATDITASEPSNPHVFGIDLLETEPLAGAEIMQGNILNQEDLAKLLILGDLKKGDVLISDMAPNTSGDRDVDFMGISELNMATLSSANKLLLTGGDVLMKTFHGKDEHQFFVSFDIFSS
jgi:23S rRNA (uridine2552-2'-O)-methyltransferase